MSPKIPVISGKKMISCLKKAGFVVVRQKGSHVSLRKKSFRTIVPLHNELARGTLNNILRQSGLTREQLQDLLNR